MVIPERVNDEARLAALDAYEILDTPAEEGFDAVVQIARAICETPVALVSLVAGDRQWFKARAGFDLCETDLSSSVCAHALSAQDLLIIPDLTLDSRTNQNPLVTSQNPIRFYAGAPLRTRGGEAIGSLCVIDVKPRSRGLTKIQAESLRNLARQVMAQLELRRALLDRDNLIVGRGEADRRRHALLQLGDRLRDVSSAEEMTRAVTEIVGRALIATRTGFGYLDAATGEIDIVSEWTPPGVSSIAGRRRFQDYGDLLTTVLRGEPLIIDDVTTDPRTSADPSALQRLGVASLVNVPVRDGGRIVAMLIVQTDKPRIWTEEALAFLRNVADRIEVGVGRLRAEADQRILNQELSHRMKNMMVMVQSIAIQTLKSVPDRAPVEALTARILALSSAHEILLQHSWSSSPLRTVATGPLETLGVDRRVTLQGPDIDLGPRATLGLSMLLHELATNALKYGALSVETGRAFLSWGVEGSGDAAELVVEWRERGGPAAKQAPGAKGFGSRLIRLGLIGRGGATLAYGEAGLDATFRTPLDQSRNA